MNNYKANLAQHVRARDRLEKRMSTLCARIRENSGSLCPVRRNLSRIYKCDLCYIRRRIQSLYTSIYDCRMKINNLIELDPNLEEDSDDAGSVNQNLNDDVANLADVEDNEEEVVVDDEDDEDDQPDQPDMEANDDMESKYKNLYNLWQKN